MGNNAQARLERDPAIIRMPRVLCSQKASMKILSVNKFYYVKGGAERHFFDLNKELERQGHRVIPWSMLSGQNQPSRFSRYFISGRDMHRPSLKALSGMFYNREAQKKARELAEKEKPDIAHLHNIYHQFSPAIIKTLKKAGLKVVMTLHDYKIACPNAFLFTENKPCRRCLSGSYLNCLRYRCAHNSLAKSGLAALEAILHRKILKSYEAVDLFVAPSRFLKEVMAEAGIDKEKIKVAKNFTPLDFSGQPAGVKQEGHYLFYGRLSPEKGIDVLLEAVKTSPGARLKIIGSGPDFFRLQEKIKNDRLEKRVELAGPKYNGALKGEVAKAKAVFVPSLWPENMPLAVLESMAQGQIVAASRIGGLPELIRHKENGFLFEPGNPEAVKRVIADMEKLDLGPIRQSARQTAEGLNCRQYAGNIVKEYKKLLNN